MTQINPHPIAWVDENGRDTEWPIAWVHPASRESVDLVLSQDPNDQDGRSGWVWVRLQNGDLILGVYPQGDTYFSVELDADIPGDMPDLPVPAHRVTTALGDLDEILEDEEEAL